MTWCVAVIHHNAIMASRMQLQHVFSSRARLCMSYHAFCLDRAEKWLKSDDAGKCGNRQSMHKTQTHHTQNLDTTYTRLRHNMHETQTQHIRDSDTYINPNLRKCMPLHSRGCVSACLYLLPFCFTCREAERLTIPPVRGKAPTLATH